MNKEKFDSLPWIVRRFIIIYWCLQWVYIDIKDYLFPNSTIFEKINGSYQIKKEYRNF